MPLLFNTDKAAGRQSGERSEERSEVNVESTVSEVFDAIAVTVFVSPLTTISSPTEISSVNNVLVPGTVDVALPGFIVPLRLTKA